MTCLLSCSNHNGGILLSDTWNHMDHRYPFQMQQIHKIFYNTENAIMIGHAGLNTIERKNGTILHISDIVQSVCDTFDHAHYDAGLYNLYAGTQYFLKQVKLDSLHPLAIAEYIVMYFDGQMVQQKMYRYFREYYRNMRNEWEYVQMSKNITSYGKGYQFAALGTYGTITQIEYRHIDFSKQSLQEMQSFLIRMALQQIHREKNHSEKQRYVELPLEIFRMDSKGKIKKEGVYDDEKYR